MSRKKGNFQNNYQNNLIEDSDEYKVVSICTVGCALNMTTITI